MDDKALIRRWIDTWAAAGPELEAIKRRELEALTDDDVRRYVSDLFSGPYPFEVPPRTSSGLVEQQRVFSKGHRVR